MVRSFTSYIRYQILFRVIKSRRMRWVGHVAREGERRGAQRVLVGKAKGKSPLERSKCTWEGINMDVQEIGLVFGMNCSGSGQGHGTSSCEHGNERSGSLKCGEILRQLRDYELAQKVSAPCSQLVGQLFSLHVKILPCLSARIILASILKQELLYLL